MEDVETVRESVVAEWGEKFKFQNPNSKEGSNHKSQITNHESGITNHMPLGIVSASAARWNARPVLTLNLEV
jgi:hypothetical protein